MTRDLLVVKYDGISISSAKQIRDIAAYLAKLSKDCRLVVVCSATGGTTDALFEAIASIKKGDKRCARQVVSKITRRHQNLAEQVAKRPALQKRLLKEINSDSVELMALLDSMALLGEVTPGMTDYVLSFGERLSTKLVAGSISDQTGRARQAVPLTGKEAGIVTDSVFGMAKPLMDTTALRVAGTLGPLLSENMIPVVGGFVGSDQYGRLTTLGRGGSDYTATIIGACMHADEIWLMGAVDGLMTADPDTVDDAQILRHVSYEEAVEMALFGVKHMHPRTFEPVLLTKIPMRIRSYRNTADKGTLVTASTPPPPPDNRNTVKCVSRIRNSGLVDIQGGSMVGTPGTAARIFSTLASVGVNVMMISQNPSESSITIVVKDTDLDRAVNVLELKLLGKTIKKLDVTTDMTIIALIGSGMRGAVGVASRIFATMGSAGINVSMITQGSSEMNLAFVVLNDDADEAVRALHDAFELGSTGTVDS